MWLSRADAPRYPDPMVFDFDPSGDGKESFDEVRWAARRLRGVLDDIGLGSRVMTSGSRGLHVHMALDGGSDFDRVKELSRDVAELLAQRHSDRLTTEMRKKERADRIFIDYLRNDYGQTTVAPYAVRARPGAPAATPVDWDELSASEMGRRKPRVSKDPATRSTTSGVRTRRGSATRAPRIAHAEPSECARVKGGRPARTFGRPEDGPGGRSVAGGALAWLLRGLPMPSIAMQQLEAIHDTTERIERAQ